MSEFDPHLTLILLIIMLVIVSALSKKFARYAAISGGVSFVVTFGIWKLSHETLGNENLQPILIGVFALMLVLCFFTNAQRNNDQK